MTYSPHFLYYFQLGGGGATRAACFLNVNTPKKNGSIGLFNVKLELYFIKIIWI